jgi:hypothetical protein
VIEVHKYWSAKKALGKFKTGISYESIDLKNSNVDNPRYKDRAAMYDKYREGRIYQIVAIYENKA